MVTFEGLSQDTVITEDMNPELYARVEDAITFSRLSDDSTKLLEVVEEQDGEKFVTRCYTPDAVNDMEMREHSWGDADFPQVWRAFRTAFSRAKVPTVPSVLLEDVKDYQFVIVSDYIEDEVPVAEAPSGAKQEMAANLGKLVTASAGGLIKLALSPEIIQEGMFMIASAENERLCVTFTDMDPLLKPKFDISDDSRRAAFIIRATDLLWRWSNGEEREQVIGSFLNNLSDSITDDFSLTSVTSAAFTRAHNVMHGADPDHAGVGQISG